MHFDGLGRYLEYDMDGCSNFGAQMDASNARYDSRAARDKVEELERKVEKLVLVNMALWEILQEKLNLAPIELIDRIQDIDLRDGRLDGTAGRAEGETEVRECEACGRTMSRRHQQCMYCGSLSLGGDPFDELKS